MKALGTLKEMTWSDDWYYYVRRCIMGMSPIAAELSDIFVQSDNILFVMKQLEGKMPVYDAFLKGVEGMACTETYNGDNTIMRLLIKAEKKKIKNIKRKIFDEELEDIIAALYRGYRSYCKDNDK